MKKAHRITHSFGRGQKVSQHACLVLTALLGIFPSGTVAEEQLEVLLRHHVGRGGVVPDQALPPAS